MIMQAVIVSTHRRGRIRRIHTSDLWIFFKRFKHFFQQVVFYDFSIHLLKKVGLRRQAVSHLQQPRGPAEVSRLLSVSEAKVWSVLMDEMSLTDEDGGRLSLLFTAAPVLRGRTKQLRPNKS